MYAVDKISQHLDIRKILEYYNFDQITESDECFRACCKIHNGNNPTAFYWNKENKLWYCFSGECGGGDVFDLVQKIEGIGFKESIERVAFISGIDIDGLESSSPINSMKLECEKWLKKQRKTPCNKEYNIPYTKYYTSSEQFTRFSDSIIEYYNSRFCKVYPTENGLLYNKLVIPLYENGTCVGAALRDITGNFIPKWFYVPTHLKIGNILYNFDNAVKAIEDYGLNSIVLVEGIFDVWAYHKIGIDNVVGLFGSSLKDEQQKKLLQLGVDFDLSFDNDKAGIKCTENTVKRLSKYADIKIVELPEGKDPDDITSEELKLCYIERSGLN